MLRSATLATLALLTALVAACGGGAASGEGDPSTAVPGDADFYVEVVVRPEGDLREDALTAAGKVLATPDAEREIRELIDRVFAQNPDVDLDYGRDVAPWLGERAGLWADAAAGGAVALLAATDTDEAWESIQAATRRDGKRATERSHRGVDYLVDDDGSAAGIVDDFAAFGTEPELKRTIDAAGGDSLADNDDYREGLDGLADDRLAHFYADLRAVFSLAAQSDPQTAREMQQLEALIPFDRLPPLTGALLANGDRIALDVGAHIEGNALRNLGAFTGVPGTPLVREVPADSWAALGSPRVGESYRVLLDQVGGGIAKQQLESELGLDLDQDVLSWIGDMVIFVRGTTLDTLDGGAVLEVTDEERAAAGFGKIVGLLRTRGQLDPQPVRIDGAETAFAVDEGTPKPIVFARSDDRVVVTYGEDAAAEALDPGETFGDSDLYEQAKSLLDDDVDPGIVLSMPALLEVVESSGETDASFERARRYLEPLTVIAVGGGLDGDRANGRVAVGLK
jgi:Protein of unknown function (DUF3352)